MKQCSNTEHTSTHITKTPAH